MVKQLKAVNSVNNVTKYFTIKHPFILVLRDINLLSFYFDKLQSLISNSKKTCISETRLKKNSGNNNKYSIGKLLH